MLSKRVAAMLFIWSSGLYVQFGPFPYLVEVQSEVTMTEVLSNGHD